METSLVTPFLDLSYRREEHMLVARWLCKMSPDAFQAGYHHLLALAVQHHCPFWLLDVRRSLPNCAQHAQWLLYQFCPLLTPALQATTPVYAAYLVNPPHLVNYTEELLPVLAHQLNTCYRASAFIEEGPTNTWLKGHQLPQ
jgi:hypothetical protein